MNRPRTRRLPGLPLAVLAGGATALSAIVAITAAAVSLAISGHLDGSTEPALVIAGLLGALPAIITGYGASRLASGLRRLNDQALARIHPDTPEEPEHRVDGLLTVSVEFAALERTVEALRRRLRVADAIAERQRRAAETASAGMYELLSGLVAAEEGTRGQLAAELHDTAAQSLMLARTVLADVILSGGELPPDLERVADLVQEAEDQVRSVMARTRPPALRDGDLARAVTTLRDDMRARYGLSVSVSWPKEPYPLSLVGAIIVYRFFQEALVNVVKHADVDEATISLRVSESEVTATVRDEGPGFDPSATRSERGRHVGLGLLQERVRLAGGSVTIDSRPGAGTTLNLRLPRVNAPARFVPIAAVS